MTETRTASGAAYLVAKSMTEEELAKALGVPQGTVKRLRYEGKIPYVQIGRGRIIYLAESIIRWLSSKEVWDSSAQGPKNPVDLSNNPLTRLEDGLPLPSILGCKETAIQGKNA